MKLALHHFDREKVMFSLVRLIFLLKPVILIVKRFITRMHSSRMRTGRSLTVFRSLLLGEGGVCSGGVCLWGGGLLLGGVCSWGSAHGGGGGVCSQGGLIPGGPAWSWGAGVVCSRGGVCSRGDTCLVRGGAWSGSPPGPGRHPPPTRQVPPPPPGADTTPLWTEWMTDRSKNITLAKTSFQPVMNHASSSLKF